MPDEQVDTPQEDEAPQEAAKEPAIVVEAEQKTNGKSIAEGGEAEPEEEKAYWPEDWRQTFADHASAGDKKIQTKLMKQLERYVDPTAIFSKSRELESKFSEGGLIKVPGEKATEDEIALFNKTLGVPESPEDYFKDMELENGAVIGEADKPIADAFANAVHKAGATPAMVNAAMSWYFNSQEEQAAELDDSDEKYRMESERTLKDEFGPSFNRYTNAIGSLFEGAPGGADAESEGALYSRLMGGRMSDGSIIGNDPDMVRFLTGLAQEINPIATVTDGGDQSGVSFDEEIASIEKRMRTDRPAYFKDEKAQARYRELLEARDRSRARA